jgi:hypothetical protein
VKLQSAFILFSIFASAITHADTCLDSVKVLGNEPQESAGVSRDQLMEHIAGLYSAVLNDEAPNELLVDLVTELSEREGKSFAEVMGEVERWESSPRERAERVAERHAQREKEQSHFYSGLEPYLYPLSRGHRKIIEEELIAPGRITPLSTGEVQFHFRDKHRFVVGDQGNDGSFYFIGTKEASFGPGDDFAIGQVPVTEFMYFLTALGSEKYVHPTPRQFFFGGRGVEDLSLGGKTYLIRPNYPVVCVKHCEACAHAARASELTGAKYSLPTEVQWEFANRAGSTGDYHFGNDVSLLPQYAWFASNSGRDSKAVGQLLPNAFHLYDMHGNVYAWTATRSFPDYIIRGGAFYQEAKHLTSLSRDSRQAASPSMDLGFRLVRQSPDENRSTSTFTLGEPDRETERNTSAALAAPRSFYEKLLYRLGVFWSSKK